MKQFLIQISEKIIQASGQAVIIHYLSQLKTIKIASNLGEKAETNYPM